ncbi:helix-turn-helix domain-containing protein [Saccharibacillus sacchari]|uniref:Helix-turn-helix domain-containing protein n=1 Tax=Saccharibacillus sacchari TaxID=456493 RepID=A0ACC6PG27_9BACL
MNRFSEKEQAQHSVTSNIHAPRSPFFDSSEPRLGVLNPEIGKTHFRLLRYDPAPELASFVRHYWTVEWDLRGSEPYRQEVVPNPCANLVIEPGRTACYMPSAARFSYLLQEKGKVFGVKFRPGGFYPFYRKSLSESAGCPLPVEVFLNTTSAALEQALTATDNAGLCDLLDRLLLEVCPEKDTETELLHRIIAAIAEDRELTKVDALCENTQTEKRTLQRLFSRRIGLGPKWVIRLHRIQEAAEALERGAGQAGPNLLHLSHDLGYHDQAHFIKDFKAVIGVTPEAYASGTRR